MFLLPLMSCLKFTLTALWQNTIRKKLWVHNIAHCRTSLFDKRSQRSLFSTLQIGGGLINACSLKEGRFCKTKRLEVVDGDGSFDITCDCLRSKLDRQCEECEAKCFSNQRKTQFGSSDNFQQYIEVES